jgi:uncharacterized protein
MSVTDDRSTAPTTFVSPVADPAALGLAAFALTTFLLSAKNAGWMTSATGDAFLGYALAYGGLVQLLAGMWEFRNKNVFGATAFSTYGGFWIGLGLWVLLVARPKFAAAALLVPKPAALVATATAVTTTNHDLGWILLAFAIFNTYMLLWSTQVNAAVFGVFLTLEATEIILCIGNFLSSAPTPTNTIKIGGYVGVVTAAVAWYASAALVSRGMGGRLALPVGRPLIGPRP